MTKPTFPELVARRIKRDGPLMLIDIGVVAVVYLAALVIRFDGSVPPEFWATFWPFLPVVMVLHLAANHVFGLYGRMWRYASVSEAQRLVGAGAVAGLAGIVVSSVGGGVLRLIPFSVAILGATFAFIGFAAVRFQSRLFALRRRAFEGDLHNVLVVGAGEAGAMLLRDLSRHPHLGLNPVALVDDDHRKVGRSIHGVRVLGDRSAIPSLIARLEVDQVLLAVPSATSDVVRDIASLCEQENVALKVLPNVREIVGGRVTARDIRDVRIEDLLGRQQVEIDLESVRQMLAGKRVLVTGAGGSIGSEISKQVSTFDPAALLLLDHDETHLHDVAGEIPGGEMLLADIRDRDRIFDVLKRTRPQVVFHAAAHKHVPILEANPEEAFATNVVGTMNTAEAAVAAGAERFILISTDKAVKPASVMGASKRLAERAIWNVGDAACILCTVRFGNVLGSRGSVIPRFFAQIERGGPVTVTDPDMTRYFMSVQEAVQLVLQAAALSEGGEVFTLDMGEPVNILDLAHKVIRLSGRIPEKEIAITITGPRPGEKIEEDVTDPSEQALPSRHRSVVVSRPAAGSADFEPILHELDDLARAGMTDELARKMRASASGMKATAETPPARVQGDAEGAAWGRSST